MSTTIPKHFDTEIRSQLEQAQEIQIERQRPGSNGSGPRTTVWVVVAGEDVFVRSVRGPAGRWYQAIRAHPDATVLVDGKRIPVQAVPVTDNVITSRVSDAYRQKYRNSPYLPPILHKETIPTTLRLEPI